MAVTFSPPPSEEGDEEAVSVPGEDGRAPPPHHQGQLEAGQPQHLAGGGSILIS